MSEKLEPGSIAWRDLTVADAPRLRDFYSEVIGWTASEVPMGEYNDFSMNLPRSGDSIAGVCHSRGGNARLPSQWLIYVIVADLQRSIDRCTALGGKVLAGPTGLGGQGKYCVIQDPAGAVMALFEQS